MVKIITVYEIRNQVTGEKYIGQTVDANRRYKEHIRKLKQGKNANKNLQKAFEEYGEDNFLFVFTPVKTKEQAIELEKFLLDFTPDTYNTVKKGWQSEGLVKGRKRALETRMVNLDDMKEAVELYKKGNVSMKELSIEFGVCETTIHTFVSKEVGIKRPLVNKEDMKKAVELYKKGGYTHRGLAEMFGVSKRTIARYINGITKL